MSVVGARVGIATKLYYSASRELGVYQHRSATKVRMKVALGSGSTSGRASRFDVVAYVQVEQEDHLAPTSSHHYQQICDVSLTRYAVRVS